MDALARGGHFVLSPFPLPSWEAWLGRRARSLPRCCRAEGSAPRHRPESRRSTWRRLAPSGAHAISPEAQLGGPLLAPLPRTPRQRPFASSWLRATCPAGTRAPRRAGAAAALLLAAPENFCPRSAAAAVLRDDTGEVPGHCVHPEVDVVSEASALGFSRWRPCHHPGLPSRRPGAVRQPRHPQHPELPEPAPPPEVGLSGLALAAGGWRTTVGPEPQVCRRPCPQGQS